MKPIVHVMYTWNYAYRAARKGHWETFVRDRERFKLRIQRTAVSIEPILKLEHRQHIFETRFAKLLLKDDKPQSVLQPEKKKQQKQRKMNPKMEKRNRQQYLPNDCKNEEVTDKSNGKSATSKTKRNEMISNKLHKEPKIRCKAKQKQSRLPDDLCQLPSKISLKGGKDSQGQKTSAQQSRPLTPEVKNGCKVRHRMRAVIYYCNAF